MTLENNLLTEYAEYRNNLHLVVSPKRRGDGMLTIKTIKLNGQELATWTTEHPFNAVAKNFLLSHATTSYIGESQRFELWDGVGSIVVRIK